jgi:putative transposase
MLDIFAPLAWLCPDLKVTTVGHLSRIIGAMWAMTGRVTMVGRARWAGDGCTDRPVPRFLSTVMAWPVFLGVFFRPPGLDPTETDGLSWGCVCGDHVRQEDVWGERVCASLYGNPVPGCSVVAALLIRLHARPS